MSTQYEHATVHRSRYPFTIQAFPSAQSDDENPIWKVTVSAPGALYVPSLTEKAGGPVRILIEYADGTVERSQPDEDE